MRYDDCGNFDYKYEYVNGKCGYVECDMTLDSGSSRPDVSYDGGSDSVSGTSVGGSSVSASSDQSWCRPSVSQKLGDSNFLIIAECDSNPSYSRRSAIVTVRNGCKTMNFTVNQSARVDVYEFQTSRTSSNINSSGYDGELMVFIKSKKNGSRIGYSMTSKPSWVITADGPTGVDGWDYSFGISAGTNESTSPRYGTISLRQDDSGKTINISVTQAGKS